MGRTTLKLIARQLGVHHSTVSLALHGNPRISTATRRRILALAAKLDYQPDEGAVALSRRRQHSLRRPRLAFLSSEPNPRAFRELVHNRLFLAGATARAHELGFSCDLVCLGEHGSVRADLPAVLATGRFQGLILGALRPETPPLPIPWARFSVAKIDTQSVLPQVPSVSNDQFRATLTCYSRLWDLGYRRIGMAIGTHDEELTGGLYTAAYLCALADHARAARVPPLYFGRGFHAPDAAPVLRQWVRRHRVEVVMSNWYFIIGTARLAGFRVPRDLACAGLGMGAPNRAEAGIVQNHALVGARAVDTVAELWKADQRGFVREPAAAYVEGYWTPGRSAPPCG